MNLLLRWIITSLSLFAAAALVPGIHVGHDAWTAFAVMAVILGLVNAIVRPILKLLSCPLIILTLGLFILVVNALCFWLCASLLKGFEVSGFWSAFFGSILYSIVSWLLSALILGQRNF